MTDTITAPDKVQKQDRQSRLGRARNAAILALIEKYQGDFNTLMINEAANEGEKWEPRLSEEQKAEAAVRELLEAHPGLKAKFGLDEVEPTHAHGDMHA